MKVGFSHGYGRNLKRGVMKYDYIHGFEKGLKKMY
jgi:hypothetical protein